MIYICVSIYICTYYMIYDVNVCIYDNYIILCVCVYLYISYLHAQITVTEVVMY